MEYIKRSAFRNHCYSSSRTK